MATTLSPTDALTGALAAFLAHTAEDGGDSAVVAYGEFESFAVAANDYAVLRRWRREISDTASDPVPYRADASPLSPALNS